MVSKTSGHGLLCESSVVFSDSAHIYDAVYGFKDYEAEAGRIHAIIEEHSRDASTLLDVACGTGRHLEHLRAWYEVSGLDLDPRLLEIAHDRLGDVQLSAGDMVSFELGRRFDVVTCLFSSIGYVGTLERLNLAITSMAAHLRPGGLLLVEPWLTPDVWQTDRPHLLTVDEPELKIARMTIPGREGRLAVMNFAYLVGTPVGLQQFSERHEAALFTDHEYQQAFIDAGLTVDRDEHGLIGRGLYIAQLA
jgi:SAM-dependent methyltransferase